MFTQRCCIWKNTKKLKNKLKDLGYNICKCTNFDDAIILKNCINNGTIHGFGYYDESSGFVNKNEMLKQFKNDCEKTNIIDCGVNEELFLALAAIRDDSDKNQWFTDGDKDFWFISGDENCNCTIQYYKETYNKNIHKATAQELINHFQNKN